MSEETEALADRGADLEAEEHMKEFMSSLKDDTKKIDRPVVPEPQEKAEAVETLEDFKYKDASRACNAIDRVLMLAERKAVGEGHTALSMVAMLTKVKKEAEKLVKDLEEEAGREFDLRMRGVTEKSIEVGMGSFRRGAVTNVWEYSSKVEKLKATAAEAAAELKARQQVEQANGEARKTVVPPAKAYAVSV